MKNKIEVPRGTSLVYPIQLYDVSYDNQGNFIKVLREYDPTDILRFGVKLDRRSQTLLISKTLTYDSSSGCYLLNLVPEDTQDLDFDTYLYDISLQTADGDFVPVVKAAEFEVCTAITKKVVASS